MTITPCHVGCDISKDRIDVCVRAGGERRWFSLANDGAGHAALIGRMKRAGPERIVLEATGGYERAVLFALAGAGLPVVRINPRHGRDFARGLGLLAKTDRLDADVLALFAERVRPALRPVPDAATQKLQAFNRRRRQLVEMKKRETQRLSHETDGFIREDIETHIAALRKQIMRIEKELDALIAADQTLARRASLIRSVPGLGPVSAAALLAEAPELGSLDARQAASLLGVAPHACDSGRYKGRRQCWGGRRNLRKTLYMAAETARRKSQRFKAFYQRLRDAGKSHKCALIAVLRKIIVTLNAILKHDKAYA